MTIIHLKTVNPYFTDVWERRKHFEFRNNDRNFALNDEIELQEYHLATNTYSTRWILVRVTYMITVATLLNDDYVILEFRELARGITNDFVSIEFSDCRSNK